MNQPPNAPGSAQPKPVTIEDRLLHRIGVREWGLPSLCIPGKIWRSEKHATISCMVAQIKPDFPPDVQRLYFAYEKTLEQLQAMYLGEVKYP